ncbi:MAG TPA: MFS transporter [Terracidiphilus sp.]|nr:MFS transporter [Terracidiphilus sp.]
MGVSNTSEPIASTRPQADSIPRRRWRIAWLLGLGVLVNYFDRVNLSVSHASLRHDFGISDVTYGYLLGAYNWTYALIQVPVGSILDRFGVRLVGRISILVWSLASFAGASSPGLRSLFASRFLLGIGEAPTFPANAKAVGAWFPHHERSFATSLFDAAAKFASAIGVPAIGVLLLYLGWRLSFAATGLISLLYFALFFFVYREPEEDPKLTPAELHFIRAEDTAQSSASAPTLARLLRQPKVIGLSLGFGSYNYVFYLLLTWLPSYLSESLHIDLLHSFLYTGVPWLAATCTDLFIGGLLVDRLVQRGWNSGRVRMTTLVAGTAFGLGIVGAGWSHTPSHALLWITISIAGLSAAAPVGWSIPSLIAPPSSVGRVGGILNLSNQLSGIAAPIVTGYLVYARHSFTAAFAVAGVYLAIGICAYLFLLRSIEGIDAG